MRPNPPPTQGPARAGRPAPRQRHRVAIVGTGGIYRLAHGPAWARSGRARVAATCDIVPERAAQARRDTGAEADFATMDAMLAKGPDVDIVDICTPSDTHAELAVRALEAGKHVLVEKPMALDPKDAQAMEQAAAKAGRTLFVGHTRRYDARWVAMRDHIVAGRIGEPMAVRRSERCWGGFAEGDWHWDLKRSGGVLMDLGVHVADLFAWFLGARAKEVYARGLTVRPEARRSGTHDFAVVQVGFEGGRRGLLEVSWAHPKAWAPYYSSTEVLGTKGKLALSDRDTAPMAAARDALEVPRFSPLLSSNPEAFDAELGNFLDCVEGSAQPRIALPDARAAVEVVHAAQRSIQSGEVVRLEGA